MTKPYDLTQFFTYGYEQLYIDPVVFSALLPYVTVEEFDDFTTDGTYSVVWEHSGMTPAPYLPLIDAVVAETRKFLGDEIVCVGRTMWKGSEALMWHDHIDDHELHDYHALIYLGAAAWEDSAGGILQVRNLLMPDDIISVKPVYGTVVLINNGSKNYQHRVTKFNYEQPLNRIVLQLDLMRTDTCAEGLTDHVSRDTPLGHPGTTN